MPPQVNATLTAVHAAGVADDWDRAEAAGVAKWTGAAPAYLRQEVERVADTVRDVVNVHARRTLYVDTADADAAGIDTDDRLTIAYAGSTITARAVAVARSELAGVPPSLQTTKLELE